MAPWRGQLRQPKLQGTCLVSTLQPAKRPSKTQSDSSRGGRPAGQLAWPRPGPHCNRTLAEGQPGPESLTWRLSSGLALQGDQPTPGHTSTLGFRAGGTRTGDLEPRVAWQPFPSWLSPTLRGSYWLKACMDFSGSVAWALPARVLSAPPPQGHWSPLEEGPRGPQGQAAPRWTLGLVAVTCQRVLTNRALPAARPCPAQPPLRCLLGRGHGHQDAALQAQPVSSSPCCQCPQ